eukprot:320278-Prymnesium_polylepis.1
MEGTTLSSQRRATRTTNISHRRGDSGNWTAPAPLECPLRADANAAPWPNSGAAHMAPKM